MNNKYYLMPLNYQAQGNNEILLSNDCGEFLFIDRSDFDSLLSGKINVNSSVFFDLSSKQFVAHNTNIRSQIELAATKYRTRKSFLKDFTSLHMMVITYRCNHNCKYCQVTSVVDDSFKYDMGADTAKKVVDTIFQSPSNNIKIEFQGGEPLLNWNTVKETVIYAEQINKKNNKNLEFVLCTNLTLLDKEKCDFLNDHNVLISTSLDGPKEIHDGNRILRNGRSSYNHFMEKLDLANNLIGFDKIGPLMTTTKISINRLKEVIDEYIKLGFHCIFIRPLNPYGFASENIDSLGYSAEEFVYSFKNALDYIIDLNLRGNLFSELYTTLLLNRILTPFGTGFVDLQSPSGAGISGVIYDYNGDVYPADEARMLARMGDQKFKMGNVHKNSYEQIFFSPLLRKIVSNSCLEIMPQCSSCVYQPYCGSDPVRNYLENKDPMGHRPSSSFCSKNMGIFDMLFRKLRKNNLDELDVFWSWMTKRSYSELKSERI